MIKNIKRHSIIVFPVGLFLLITGLWFIINPYPAVKMPDEEPIVYLSVKENGIEKEIEVMKDGTVFQVLKQDGDAAGTTSLMIWEKGLLTKEEQAVLTGYLQSDEIRDLDNLNEYPLPSFKGTPADTIECRLCLLCGDDQKTAVAVTPHRDDVNWLHPEAPYPLNELYLLLLKFGDTTLEIFREEIDS